jgi:prepilin-type N-terminal cleavage/methylation domain-containing protein
MDSPMTRPHPSAVRGGCRPAGDDGYSIAELLITMAIMSIVLVVATGGIIQIYSTGTRVESMAYARDQLTNAFRRLDKELRYASWVAKPGLVGTRWYLEYALPSAGCRQLEFTNGGLTLTSWTLPGRTPGTPNTIAALLSQNGTTAPFTVYRPGDKPYRTADAGTAGVGRLFDPEHQQVRLRFDARVGRVTIPLDIVFTAQNTNRNTPALNDCSKGRPAT